MCFEGSWLIFTQLYVIFRSFRPPQYHNFRPPQYLHCCMVGIDSSTDTTISPDRGEASSFSPAAAACGSTATFGRLTAAPGCCKRCICHSATSAIAAANAASAIASGFVKMFGNHCCGLAVTSHVPVGGAGWRLFAVWLLEAKKATTGATGSWAAELCLWILSLAIFQVSS